MIHCCMNRKQEIRQQIQFLQGELAAMEEDVVIEFNDGCGGELYTAKAASLKDEDIINALKNHPAIDKFIGEDVTVWFYELNYSEVFHVTETRTLNITPF